MSPQSEMGKAPSIPEVFTQGTVNIKVGEGDATQVYTVHKALLVYHSEYFKCALASQLFVEGETGEVGHVVTLRRYPAVVLEDVEPTTVAIFIDWLYTQQLPKPVWSEHSNAMAWNNRFNCFPRHIDIASLSVFADRFLVKGLTAEISKIMKVDITCPTPETIEFAHNNLPGDHEFLGHLANCFVVHWMDKENLDIKEIENFPKLFLCQVIAKFAGDNSKLVKEFNDFSGGTSEDDLQES